MVTRYNILVVIFDRNNKVADIPQGDILSMSLTDGLNGGSGIGGSDTIVFKRPFNQIGAIANGYRVLVWWWPPGTTRPVDPWYAGFIMDFDQEQAEATGKVSIVLAGDFMLLNDPMISGETINPGVGSNPSWDCAYYLNYLIPFYQPTTFSAPTLPGSMFTLYANQLTKVKLASAIDTLVKQGRDTSGALYTWFVRGKADLSRRVIVQADQNPNVIGGVRFKHLFLQSQLVGYKIQTKYRDIVNMIAIEGGKDSNGQQVFGVYQDPAAITALNGRVVQEIRSVPQLISKDAAQQYATTQLAIYGYAQATSGFEIIEPDPSIFGGTWLQVNETPATATTAAVIKQVRCAMVTVSYSGERLRQAIQTQSPTPYLDAAIYRLGLNVAAEQATRLRGLPINRQTLFIRQGGEKTSTANSPARIALSAVQAVFPGSPSATLLNAAAMPLTQLTDNSGGANNGQTGDGPYTISLTSAGAYVITKGATPPNIPTQQNLLSVLVVGGIPAQLFDIRTFIAGPLMPTSAYVNGPQIASGVAAIAYPNGVGNLTFDAKVDVTLTSEASTLSPWLVEIELMAAAHGAANTTATRVGVLGPNATGVYTLAAAPLFSQLSSNQQWDLYARYSDGVLKSAMLALGTTNLNAVSSGTAFPAMPASLKTSGPTLTAASFVGAQRPGVGVSMQDVSVTLAVADYLSATLPPYAGYVRFRLRVAQGIAGDVKALANSGTLVGQPVDVAFTTSRVVAATLSAPSGGAVDVGVSYFDAQEQESAIQWAPGSTPLTFNATLLGGINFVADSNYKLGTTLWKAASGAASWHVASPVAGAAPTLYSPSVASTDCEYSRPFTPVPGMQYVVSFAAAFPGSGGTMKCGVVDISDFNARSGAGNLTPVTIYGDGGDSAGRSIPTGTAGLYVSYPPGANFGPGGANDTRGLYTWTCPSSGSPSQVCFAAWCVSATGQMAIWDVQMKIGTAFAGYTPGDATTNTSSGGQMPQVVARAQLVGDTTGSNAPIVDSTTNYLKFNTLIHPAIEGSMNPNLIPDGLFAAGSNPITAGAGWTAPAGFNTGGPTTYASIQPYVVGGASFTSQYMQASVAGEIGIDLLIAVEPNTTYTFMALLYQYGTAGAGVSAGIHAYSSGYVQLSNAGQPVGSPGAFYSAATNEAAPTTAVTGSWRLLMMTFNTGANRSVHAVILADNPAAGGPAISVFALQLYKGNKFQDFFAAEPPPKTVADTQVRGKFSGSKIGGVGALTDTALGGAFQDNSGSLSVLTSTIFEKYLGATIPSQAPTITLASQWNAGAANWNIYNGATPGASVTYTLQYPNHSRTATLALNEIVSAAGTVYYVFYWDLSNDTIGKLYGPSGTPSGAALSTFLDQRVPITVNVNVPVVSGSNSTGAPGGGSIGGHTPTGGRVSF